MKTYTFNYLCYLLPEELGNESASWSNELSLVASRQEKLLGDVFQVSISQTSYEQLFV